MAKRRPSPVDIEVGRRIKLQRMTAGLSQTELGNELGVSFQQVQKYEKGVNRVGAGRLTKIASVLDVPINVFFDGAAEASKAAHGAVSATEMLAAPYALRLLNAFSTIDDEKIRSSIVRLVEGIATERSRPRSR